MTIEKQKTLPDLLLDDETFELLMDCIHCGFCLPTCPTFALTGDETDSPRGRLYYMRLMAEGRVAASPSVLTHLDRCLDCRACETACPSGVQYGFLIERVRSLLAQKGKGPVRHSFFYQFLIRYIFPFANRTEVLFSPVRISQKLGISKILCRLPFLGRLMSMVPPLPPLKLRHLPERLAPAGPKKGRVGLLTGCVGSVFYSNVNWAAAEVLAAAGYEVIIPTDQPCCGSLLAHSGFEKEATFFARALMESFFRHEPLDAIIVTAAGCGATMKSYHHHSCDDDPAWVDKAKSFSAKVFDFSEFLDRNDINLPFRPLPWTVTYHDPCHLAHGQQIREAPRRLLQKIPGIQYVELDESDWCCGSAGVYNILQQEIADQILARKMTNIARTGAQVVVTANPGCLVQLYYGLQKFGIPARLLHLAEVLKEALMGRQ